MIGTDQDAVVVRLCEAMGRPNLARDPLYADIITNAWTGTLTVAEVEAAMIAHSVPAGRIYRALDMIADPHFAAR